MDKFNKYYDENNWHDGFSLYAKYSRKDVFRILNVETNPVAQNVGGYLVDPDNVHCPIFVNYHKSTDISESRNIYFLFVNFFRLFILELNSTFFNHLILNLLTPFSYPIH